MTPQNYNEATGRMETMPAFMLNSQAVTQVASHVESAGIEAWISALLKLAEEQEKETQALQDAGMTSPSREGKCPLPKLEAGPWRSLGGYFDYSLWPDRDRFLELDKAIAAGQDIREDDNDRDLDMV